MPTQYERDRIARVAARAGKKPAKKGKKSLSQREKAQADINKYNARYRSGAKSTDTRPLDTLGTFGKPLSTATSGGSQSVRKVTAEDAGDSDLVRRLRDKPFKYLKK